MNDIIFCLGLGCVIFGLTWVHPALALIAIGGILMFVALLREYEK